MAASLPECEVGQQAARVNTILGPGLRRVRVALTEGPFQQNEGPRGCVRLLGRLEVGLRGSCLTYVNERAKAIVSLIDTFCFHADLKFLECHRVTAGSCDRARRPLLSGFREVVSPGLKHVCIFRLPIGKN